MGAYYNSSDTTQLFGQICRHTWSLRMVWPQDT